MCHGCLTTLSLTNIEKVSFSLACFQQIPSYITIYPKRRRLVAGNNKDKEKKKEKKRKEKERRKKLQRNPLRAISMRKEDWRKNRLGIRETLLPPSSLPFLSSPPFPLRLNNGPPSPPFHLPCLPLLTATPSSLPSRELVSRAFCTRNFALGGNVHDLYASTKVFAMNR